MKKFNETILIDKYITGKLEDTELWEFKANMENDPELAREVKMRQEIYNTIGDDEKMKLMTTLLDISGTTNRPVRKINLFSQQFQAIAASIIVILTIGAAVLTNHLNKPDMNMIVYNEFFTDEGSLLTTRSGVETTNAVETGIEYYDNNEYEKAIDLLIGSPDNVTARLYAGLAYMKLEKFGNAEEQFKYILKHNDNIFIDQAEWNLGLSYLASKKTNEANEIFSKIASEDGAYRTKADEIINQLKNN